MSETFINRYLDLFQGTPDCYAISHEWKLENGDMKRIYFPSNYSGNKDRMKELSTQVVQDIGTDKYGPEAVLAHLQGRHFLGVYPIFPDSTVRFFALDFDKDEEYARKAAARQQEIFLKEAGLRTYIERSRSGGGYHLWGFLEAPINAGELRFALAPFIEDTETYDRMFPNQDGTTEQKPYGNLIALPLYGPNVKDGKGAFILLDPITQEAEEIPDQKQFLLNVERITPKQIAALAETRSERYVAARAVPTRKIDPEGLPGIYKVIHPLVGCQWVNWCREFPEEITEPEWYALACQFAQLEGGREMFHEFSALDPNRYDVASTDAKFDHALEQNSPHTCGWMRENLNGPECDCDRRFAEYGVTHPYDLAKVPFNELLELINLESHPETAAEGLFRVIEQTKHLYKHPDSFQGFAYGFPELDQYTELRPNDLIVMAARPGRGKSAWMVDMIYRVAKAGKPVYVYSMEMTKDQLWGRMLARIAQVDGKRLQKGTLVFSEWRRILAAAKELEENPLPIYIDDSTYDATDIVNKCAELVAQHGPGLIVVDYLQMATNHPGETDYQKNSRVPRQYKLLAKGMGCPAFILAQMNREGEDLTEESETLDRVIEGSGKIEQYADVIFFMLGPRAPGIVERTLVQHKDRHREAGHRIVFDFNQPVMTFQSQGAWSAQAKGINQSVKAKIAAATGSGKGMTARDFFSQGN